MLYPVSILSLVLLLLIHLTNASHQGHEHQHVLKTNADPVSSEAREYWMGQANQALLELVSPCPFAAFGTVIVNHTDTTPELPFGKLVCKGVNQNQQTGNPTLHGTSPSIDPKIWSHPHVSQNSTLR